MDITIQSFTCKNNRQIPASSNPIAETSFHNALDKVRRPPPIQGIPFNDKAFLSSRRTGTEIILRTTGWGIPLSIANSWPTSKSVETDEHFNITHPEMAGGGIHTDTHAGRIQGS